MRTVLLASLLVITSIANAAPRVDVIQSISLSLADTLTFLDQYDPLTLALPFRSNFSMSDDGRRLLVPVPNGGTGDAFRAPLALYDRSTKSMVDVLAPSDAGNLLPPLAIDVLSSSGDWLVGRNIDGSLFRWNQSFGAELLRDEAGNPFRGQAVAVSQDGRRIVGNKSSWERGFEYLEANGFVKPFSIDQLNPGVSLASDLIRIGGMSDDGSTLVVHVAGPKETLLAPGIWNVLPTLKPLISADGSIIFNFDTQSRILIGGIWENFGNRLVPVGISADGSTLIGFERFITSSGLQLMSRSYPYFERDDSGGGLADLTTQIPGIGPIYSYYPPGTFLDVTTNRLTYYAMLATETSGPGVYQGIFYFVTVSVPEVSPVVLVGFAVCVMLLSTICRRWRFSR